MYACTRARASEKKHVNQLERWVYKSLHLNYVQMNHVQMNLVQMNRVQMNHVQMNHVQMNRVQMNRVQMNPFDYSTTKHVPIYEYLFIRLFEAIECVLKACFNLVAIVVHVGAQMPVFGN